MNFVSINQGGELCLESFILKYRRVIPNAPPTFTARPSAGRSRNGLAPWTRMVNTGAEGAPGINGGLMKNTQVKTTTNTIGVDSVDAAVKTVQSAGGKLIMPKTPIPTVGYFAYLEDTEGNLFGVMQADKNAK